MMLERARMVSGASRNSHVVQSDLWLQLAGRLTTELEAIGVEVASAPEPAASAVGIAQGQEDVDENERIRLLQLRVDYYRTTIEDYQDLFQAYMGRGQTKRGPGRVQAVVA